MSLSYDSRWVARAVILGLVLAAGRVSVGYAQERSVRWAVSVDVVGRLPSTIYERRITARTDETSVTTRYFERTQFAPGVRLSLLFRPQSMFSGFFTAVYGRSETIARYSGGIEPREAIGRSLSATSFQAGIGIRVVRWNNGRGVLSYLFGPILLHQSLDLSNGHRDPLAYAFDTVQARAAMNWSDRSWFSWGLGLGLDVRIPMADGLALHVGLQDRIVAVGTATLALQEQLDVHRLVNEKPTFRYPSFIAHYPGFRVGLEYVIAREPAPIVVDPASLPPLPPPDEASDFALAALRMARDGERERAIALVRNRVADVPSDHSAWRALAILLTSPPPTEPDARADVARVLRRALARNPGDRELLAAFGRIGAAGSRTVPATGSLDPLVLSTLNVVADAAGGLSLAWAVHRTGSEPRPYRVRVEIFDADGAPVRVRRRGASNADSTTTVVRFERAFQDPNQNVRSQRLELRILRPRSGQYSARIRMTDLVTGSTIQRVAGFSIP